MIADILASSLEIGVLIALTALGYALIFSVLKFINFAHGDLITVGAYTGVLASRTLQASLPVAIVASFAVSGTLGLVIERLAFRRLRDQRLGMFLSSFGVSLILTGALSIVFTSSARRVDVAGSEVSFGSWTLLAAVTLLAGGAAWILNRTLIGVALRALAADAVGAELIGIRPDRLISGVFFVASGLAGVAGLILAMRFGATPDLGAKYGIWAFAVVLIAGFGSLAGIVAVALLSGVVLGSVMYFFGSASYANAVLFAVMAVILLFRPNGLFGAELRRF